MSMNIEKGAHVRLLATNGTFTVEDLFAAEGIAALRGEDGKEYYALVECVRPIGERDEPAEGSAPPDKPTGPKSNLEPVAKGVLTRLIAMTVPFLPIEWAQRAEAAETIVQIGVMSVLASWTSARREITNNLGPRTANSVAETLVKAAIEASWMKTGSVLPADE